MKILNILGKVGAIAAAGVGLVLAGKSGFGSDLFQSKDEDNNTDDLQQVPVPEQTEVTTEVVEEVQEDEEVPE
jgi:hypothetical protein